MDAGFGLLDVSLASCAGVWGRIRTHTHTHRRAQPLCQRGATAYDQRFATDRMVRTAAGASVWRWSRVQRGANGAFLSVTILMYFAAVEKPRLTEGQIMLPVQCQQFARSCLWCLSACGAWQSHTQCHNGRLLINVDIIIRDAASDDKPGQVHQAEIRDLCAVGVASSRDPPSLRRGGSHSGGFLPVPPTNGTGSAHPRNAGTSVCNTRRRPPPGNVCYFIALVDDSQERLIH